MAGQHRYDGQAEHVPKKQDKLSMSLLLLPMTIHRITSSFAVKLLLDRAVA